MSLSARDRLRLAELMRAPLIPPAKPAPEQSLLQRFEKARYAVEKKTIELWHAWSAGAVKKHLAAHGRQWAAGAALVVLCVALAGVVVKVERRPPSGSIQLQALDREGQLHIRWDANSDLILRATGARLFITDGAERLFVRLDNVGLRRGWVRYARRSDRVELRMALAEPDGQFVEQQATFDGARPSPFAQPGLEARAQPVAPLAQPVAPPAQPPAQTPITASPHTAPAIGPATGTGHRARTKPVEQSGAQLPFTCSPGDVFRKTDAPVGWDTFTCRSRNVWSMTGTQRRDDRSDSKPNPSATTLTAKPASPSTM